MHKGRKVIAALSAALLLGVSACGSDEPEVRAAASASPSSAATSAARSAEPSPSPLVTTEVDPAEMVFFQAPSGNIACSLSGDAASCDIREYSYTPPEKPSDCDLDFGAMVSLRPGEPASFRCHGDTNAVGDQALPSDLGPLPYGEAITNGVVRCVSNETEMSCETADGAHGFALSRAEYVAF